MKQRCSDIMVTLTILLLGIIFHKNYINEFPSHTHAWAQSDRYALALGFVNNNLNFFKPETFVLNHQFPGNWKVPGESGTTAVDFPVHDYIPAIIMKVSGYKSAWIFRIYILLYSIPGLFFLYKLTLTMTGDYLKSIFVAVFAATSPVFVYYQGGFLPTIPSLSNAIIGIYFYLLFLNYRKDKYFSVSLLFLTLATLSRTTFAIPLLSVFGTEFLRIMDKKSKLKSKILPVTLSFAIIMLYYLYNGYLRDTYGSIFLNHFLPPKNIQHASEIISIVKEKWIFKYFSIYHYLIVGVIVIGSTFTILFKKAKKHKHFKNLFLLTAIMLTGCILFSVLMLCQFANHDYYFLDTWFLPLILLLIITMSFIPFPRGRKATVIFSVLIIFISIPFVLNAYNTQKQRREKGYWDKTTATIRNYSNSSSLLDSLDISKQSKILVTDAYAPNIPFILMNRKGYAIMSTKKEIIESALKWDYDYLTIQNEFFLTDIYPSYPEIIQHIKKVGDNGNISVCRYSKRSLNQSLPDFIGLTDKSPVFHEKMTFDTIADKSWQNMRTTTKNSVSGSKAGILTQNMDFGVTFKTENIPGITEKGHMLYFKSYFMCDTIQNFNLVVSVTSKGEDIYYNAVNIGKILKQNNKWEQVDLFFQLPVIQTNDYIFALYLWNTGNTEVLIDDPEFGIYE